VIGSGITSILSPLSIREISKGTLLKERFITRIGEGVGLVHRPISEGD